MEVIPGILEKEWSAIERKIEIAKPFASTIHIDIIDGKFAPNTSFLDPKPFKKFISPTEGSGLFFELHMMVVNPIQYLKPFADAGFKRFIGHVESFKKPEGQVEFVAKAQSFGEVGLAIDGPTDLSAIKVSYSDLDSVLIMMIKAGESGQKFNPAYLEKVGILRFSQDDIKIAVDGGINDETIFEARNVGATRFVANSFIFNAPNPQERFSFLKKCLE